MKALIENLVGEGEAAQAIQEEHQRIVDGYEARIRTMQADFALQQAVQAAGGRNLTAIRAILDESAIQNAEDMAAAAKEAVGAVKRSSPYLFVQPGITAPGTGMGAVGQDYTQAELGKLPLAEYRRYRRG